MPTALQLPPVSEPATRLGRKRFRKQILPLGSIDHPEKGRLDFTGQTLQDLIAEFDGGAYDVVPFVLANERNEHNDDPERVRGEVTKLEADDDGLYAVIETTRRGAKLVEENPKLPVSVRIIPPAREGARPVLAHVCGTLDPVAKGMSPWEAIDASSDLQVVDLSGGVYSSVKQMAGKDATTEQGKDAPLSEEELKQFRALLAKLPDAEKPNGDKASESDDDKSKDKQGEGDELTAEEKAEAARFLDALVDAAETDDDEKDKDKETDRDKDREPVAASLDAKSRRAIELAESKASDAEGRVSKVEAELAATRAKAECDEYVREGVPPVLVELSMPALELPDGPIEMSNGEKFDAKKFVRGLLDAAKDTIDFSERGSELTADDDENAAKEARELAEKAAERYA